MSRRIALGLTVRTGRAVVVAVGGEEPEVLARARVDVAATFEEGAVFHMAQELADVEQARVHVRAAEARLTERARAGLAAFAEALEGKLVGAAMVAPAARPAPPLETILRAHPLVHAAEGELYRRVFAEAGAALGVRPQRVAADALARSVARAAGLTPARVDARLAAMGKAAGKPWAAEQKQAALAAWLALVGVSP